MVSTDPEVVPGHTETPDSIELKASAVASGCIEKNTFPYSCKCGKGFSSISNMKKHVRFHINCQYCGDIQQNVGGLRKHIKIAHPEVHQTDQKKKMAKDVVLRNPDKKDVVKKPKASRIKDRAKDPTQLMEAAEQIDDGGSRFKFACTMCKRRFSSHINMCRHQSKHHETPEMVAKFYNNVASNIALNLTSYLDGGHNSLQNCSDHIRIGDYDELPTEKSADIPWDRYNFPLEFSTAFHFTENVSSASKENMDKNNVEETSVKCFSDLNMEILYGKHGNITCICEVCRKQFYDLDCLVCHHLKKHPSVAFNFLGFEQGDGIDLLPYSKPSNIGVLAVTSTGLEGTMERDIYHCTGCGDAFENVSRLHVHIVKCVSTSNPGRSSDS